VKEHGRLDILINNAANNPKMTGGEDVKRTRLENFPLDWWTSDLAVGLTGTFLCCQAAGRVMVEAGRGVIINIASDMGIISPDQRVYLKPGQKEGDQAYKPITYSVVKGGLISMTRWLATYLAPRGIRVNTLTPASVFDHQPGHLVDNLSVRIPLARMSHPDEFKGALLFLASDASSYMTGQNLVLDGGRSIW
jgi:NAD(P)-dependent dehydrogenase (short-subunit alcohol dehydrogenase family)